VTESANAQIREALDAGLNTEALDLARKAVFASPDAAEPRYLGALACARMGATGEAERWLGEIDRTRLENDALAAEVWSLAGRIAKERFSAAKDRTHPAASASARAAIDCYRRAYEISGSAYPAANAATLAMLSGDAALSKTLARDALHKLAASGDHWHHATSGEALLALGRLPEARQHYEEAYRLAGNRFGDIASMRRQLRLIGSSAALELLDAIPAPHIIAFSGHMIDHPARTTPRFPPALEPAVASALRERLAHLGPSIGYAQPACGADILFLEAMQDAGMQTQIVLPFAKPDFIETSVRFAGEAWCERFERVLARATRVILATEEAFLGDQVLFEHAAHLIQGMAILRARELLTQPLALTVHEPGSRELAGGTAASARIWARNGGQTENIDLAVLRGGAPADQAKIDEEALPERAGQSGRPRSLKSLFFADISGFSGMPEEYTPPFVEMFLETCQKTLESLEHQAVDANTRGDALFIVFDLPSHAAEFAIRLQQAMSTVDWPAFGISGTGVRIGLHTGPVFDIYDPVMSKTTFYGTHVNRAARLEPIVQPGHIFVTEAFAASLVAENEGRFTCDYIGAMPLAKQFGEARLYRLRWSGED